VIEALNKLNSNYESVAGFEANGGFILGSDVVFQGAVIKALPTRDALLPVIVVMCSALEGIHSLVEHLPSRFTFSARIQNYPVEKSQKLICEAISDPNNFITLFGYRPDDLESVNTHDGFRVYLKNQDIVHIRPSGNAPELRIYAESYSSELAESLVNTVIKKLESFVFVDI
jgi:phosphomannomutase